MFGNNLNPDLAAIDTLYYDYMDEYKLDSKEFFLLELTYLLGCISP